MSVWVQTMEERFDYGLNPKKLGALSSYLCDPATAPAEFLLVKSQYQAETGRAVERGALFFQIRQAFPPGEVTAEEANQIGYETVMRWTKGKYQFFVCTHTDKGHIHNHREVMLNAHPVREPPQSKAGADKIMELPGAVKGR